MAPNSSVKKYSLTIGENTYSSPAAVNEADARKLQSLIPSLSGALERERPALSFATNAAFSSRIGFFHEFKRNDAGVITYYWFCATASRLYMLINPLTPAQAWSEVIAVGALAGFPVAVNINNAMHLSDGASSWIFTGANTWFKDGLEIAVNSPAIAVTVGAGTALIQSNRYYWTSYFDDGSVTKESHESSASPISIGTGAVNVTGGNIVIRQEPGTISHVTGTNAVTGVGTLFNSRHVGMKIGPLGGAGYVTIASVTDATHLTLASNPAIDNAAIPYNILPLRATGWNVYASSSEEDKVGNLLALVNANATSYVDTSPMIGTVGSIFQNVTRPLLNDPPHPTKIMEVHKNRIWRQLPSFPNFFSYTAYEEVLAEQAGTPSECIPGADSHTVSPAQVNETSYPDQSAFITCIRKHGDALYIASELNAIPLYGGSLADFDLSEAQAFAVGFAGRRASCSTPFGLAFVSYDLKVYLYPSQYSFGVDSTTALVELGRPKRPEFEQIDGTDFENMHLIFYNWGRRNWLILSYRRADQSFATWVFDFEVKGWFQLQQGYTAVTVFTMSPGKKVLIGAAADNRTYIIDDLTGTFPVPANTVYPVGYLRVLLDFGDPNSVFVYENIGYEKSNGDMEVDVTVWLDPEDPENPGDGILVPMVETRLGANSFRGRPNSDTGSTCQRALVEFAVAASPVNGRFHGYTVVATKIEDPVL